MYPKKPSEYKIVDTISIRVENEHEGASVATIIDAFLEIQKKYPNVKQQDVRVVEGAQFQLHVEYEHLERNPNYEKELKNYRKEKAETDMRIYSERKEFLTKELERVEKRIYRLNASTYDAKKLSAEKIKAEKRLEYLHLKINDANKKLYELKNEQENLQLF